MRAPLHVVRQLPRLLRSQWSDDSAIRAAQSALLLQTLRHASTQVPAYRRLGLSPADLAGTDALRHFPRLTRRTVQTSPDDYLADGVDRVRLHVSRTSGSTGEPLETRFDDSSWAFTRYALKIRRTLAVAPPLFHRCLIVSEQPLERIAAYRSTRPWGLGPLYRERVVSIFDPLESQLAAIDEFRPDMVYAYPSWLLEMAAACRGRNAAQPRIPWLFTSSELLTAQARSIVESTFDGRIYDVYGCTEFKEVAWQCRHGTYHVNWESVYVESVPALDCPGATSLLLTTLCNRAMPLIRYDTGDLGSVSEGRCACGRAGPQLLIAGGRVAEQVQLPSGRRLSPYALTMTLEDLPGLLQYRLVHTAPDTLVVELLGPGPWPEDVLAACRQRLADVLQEPLRIELRRVDAIPRTAAGKRRVYLRQW